jgi:hypothetical protein
MKENITKEKRRDTGHPSSFIHYSSFIIYYSLFIICSALLAGCIDPTTPLADSGGIFVPANTDAYADEDGWEIIEEPDDDDETAVPGVDLPPNYDGSAKTEDERKPLKDRIIFADAGSFVATGNVAQGATVTTITFPDTGDTWTAELASGPGDTDNALFKIVPEPAVLPSVRGGVYLSVNTINGKSDVTEAKLVFKEAVTLVPILYSARIKISNGNNFTGYKIFTFDITLTPPAFTEAPKVYPQVREGKNYLDIRWGSRATATSYTVYVGKSDDFNAAKILGTYNASSNSAEMTAFPDETGDLPGSTYYWVWTTATNANGTTLPSPPAKKKTSAPVQEFFWKANDENIAPMFDCYAGDYYRFTQTAIKYWFGVEHYIGDIYYHEIFDPPSSTSNSPFPDKLKDTANCIGLPAGVFIIKYREDHVSGWLKANDKTGKKRYSAVYYWGMGATVPDGKPHAGEIESGIVNQWNGYAETETLEEALDKFTCANVKTYVHVDPESYKKVFTTENRGTHGGEPLFGEDW